MNHLLQALCLVKSYQSKKVVDGVSLQVERGEIVGLLGPNGAGKTTTFSIIIGLISGDEGRVFLDKDDLTNLPMFLRARRGLSLLPQEPSLFRKLTVEENILAVDHEEKQSQVKKKEKLEQLLEEFGLIHLANCKAFTLSGGERRRLEIARALVGNPAFILLDEPFTGIDPLTIINLQDILIDLKEKGLGVLVTDHSVRETFKIADRAYIMDNGQILEEGTPEKLMSSASVRDRYLGEDFFMD